MLYGITKPTTAFAKVACHLLENIDHLAVLVVSFEGAVALVRAFEMNGIALKIKEKCRMSNDKIKFLILIGM